MGSALLFRIATFILLGLVLAIRVCFTKRVRQEVSTFSLIRLISFNDWSDSRFLLKRSLRQQH